MGQFVDQLVFLWILKAEDYFNEQRSQRKGNKGIEKRQDRSRQKCQDRVGRKCSMFGENT